MRSGVPARTLFFHFAAILCLVMAADTLSLFAGYNKLDPSSPLSHDLPIEELENLASEYGNNPYEFLDRTWWWHFVCGLAGGFIALIFSLMLVVRKSYNRATSFLAVGLALGTWQFLTFGGLQYLFLTLVQIVTGDQNWYRSADMGFFALPERQISLAVFLLVGMCLFFFLLKERREVRSDYF